MSPKPEIKGWIRFFIVGLLSVPPAILCGCGGGGEQPPTQAGNAQPPETASPATAAAGGKLTASRSDAEAGAPQSPATNARGKVDPADGHLADFDPDDDENDNEAVETEDSTSPPEKGSAEWLVRQMILLRLKPFPEEYDAEQLKAARRNRNLQIVELAEEAVPLALKDPEKTETFNAAVNQLVEARFQLALTGNEEDIAALYEVADVLYKKDPKAKVAADAAYAVAELAQINARAYSAREKSWLQEFANQARMFAVNFPDRDARAVQLLDAAGRTCEYYHLPAEAVQCYDLIRTRFPKSSQAELTQAILRRLKLQNKLLTEFGGPTLGGGHVNIQDYRGKPLLIVFWSTEAQAFADAVSVIAEFVERQAEKTGFSLIGVCLDENELAVEPFLEQFGIRGPQIFDPDPVKRQWNHPLVKYYGVRDIPMYWLVDRNGIVTEMLTAVDPPTLETELSELLQPAGEKQVDGPETPEKQPQTSTRKKKVELK